MQADYDVIQWASLGADLDDDLARRYRVLRVWDEPELTPQVVAPARSARVAITSVRKGFSAEAMALLPELEAVSSWGVGYDTLDVAAARERGIVVANTPGVLDDCVADMAWALLLSAARRTAVADRYVKTGQWRTLGAFPLSTRVWGKRLGILGLGRIGQAIAERGTGFRMDVRYTNRRVVRDASYGFEPSLIALAEWADFLIVACPGGAQTRHLVSEDVLRALGPNGILVNIARGSVVDQAAMLRVLREGALGGAGLDVLDDEPGAPPALTELDQVSLTPHMASATRETRRDMAELVARNAISFLETGEFLTPVPETVPLSG